MVWLFLSLAAVPAAPAQDAPSLEPLAWLTGCWARELPGGGLVEEQWTAPRGGTLLGVNRTVRGEKTVAFEYLRIEARDGRLRYIAIPSGQRETAFALVELTDDMALFENPDHDFPQRIRYRRMPDGSLLAQIEGTRNGETRVIDFPMKRVGCGT